jgi:glyceraldehyde-3-phosphate dehydrogenase (NADP+)
VHCMHNVVTPLSRFRTMAAGTGYFQEILNGEVYKYFADGEWKVSASGKSVPIVDPFSREVTFRVQGKAN